MCGIVGAVAQRDITPILVEGLKRLEYRRYDSCGAALYVDGHLPRDNTPFDQTAHPPQASRRRGVHPGGQFLVGQRTIVLQLDQNAPIQIVKLNPRWRFIMHVISKSPIK